MERLNEYLIKQYGDTSSNLSKSFFGNSLTDENFIMINLDNIAKDLLKNNEGISELYTSVDALYINKRNESFEFFFIEFKRKNFELKEDKFPYLTKFNNLIEKLKKEADYEFIPYLERYSQELIDESYANLKIKPYDSLSIMYHIMNNFFEKKTPEECIEKLHNSKKYYVLVSKTNVEYNYNKFTKNTIPLKNMSNRNARITKPLRFMERLIPYHFDNISAVNTNGFNKLINGLKYNQQKN